MAHNITKVDVIYSKIDLRKTSYFICCKVLFDVCLYYWKLLQKMKLYDYIFKIIIR